jgi:branched-chain amino acid transport system permease protein
VTPSRSSALDGGTLRRFSFLAPLVLMVLALELVGKGKHWSLPAGVIVQGTLIGGLTALLAVGVALVYRANRIINFAQGDLGAFPATLAVLLMVTGIGLPYPIAFVTGLAAAIVLGALVEWLIIRRFFRAPRLVLTVATIGVSQILAGSSLLLPRGFGRAVTSGKFDPPFHMKLTVGGFIFRANDVIALAAVPLVLLGLALFLSRSNVGIAIRGSAERADRAAMLGIPVQRLQTVVWMVASALAFVTMFLRAGVVGLPIGQVLGPAVLLRALAAVVIGRMDHLPRITAAAIGLGIIEQGVVYNSSRDTYIAPVLFVVILVALLLERRRRGVRVDEQATSTWQAAREVRPIPREMIGLPEIKLLRYGSLAVIVGAIVTLPMWLPESRINLASAITIYAIVGVSLVVLTGWAGQVSLGQMAFVAVGAAVGGALTEKAHWDLGFALIVGGLVGAAVAVLIGLPSLRARGLALAVTSLSFALATSQYLLDPSIFHWLPDPIMDRPKILGSISVTSETSYFFLCLTMLAFALVAARSLRRSRTGRVLIAMRENEKAAEAFGINATRTKLLGFAISGFIAAMAGVLYVHQQQGLVAASFDPAVSLQIFAMVVIGGLGSLPGAILGAIYIYGVQWFLPQQWEFLASGTGLLLVLLLLPGGLGAAIADARDGLLRFIARRRQLIVPSLLADRRVEEEFAPVPATADTMARADDEAAAEVGAE